MKKDKTKKYAFYLFIGIGVFLAIGVVIISRIQEPRINTHDGRRAADVDSMAVGLELYRQSYNEYPDAKSECRDLDVLKDYLVPDFTFEIPQERFISDGHPPYQFAISPDGNSFVVKATFYEQQSSKVDQRRLEEDLDGNVLGCNCDDPNYCVGSKNLTN